MLGKEWMRVQESGQWISGAIGNNLNESTSQMYAHWLMHSWYNESTVFSWLVVAYIFIRKAISIMWYNISVEVSRLNPKIIWMPLKWAFEPLSSSQWLAYHVALIRAAAALRRAIPQISAFHCKRGGHEEFFLDDWKRNLETLRPARRRVFRFVIPRSVLFSSNYGKRYKGKVS